jgi:hypothetical protein
VVQVVVLVAHLEQQLVLQLVQLELYLVAVQVIEMLVETGKAVHIAGVSVVVAAVLAVLEVLDLHQMVVQDFTTTLLVLIHIMLQVDLD